MATPDPYVAFLASLQDAYAASGAPANAFTPGAQGVPGAPGVPGSDPSGIAGGLGGGLGSGGASVPGTATTGSSILEGIISGGVSPDSPAGADVLRRFGGQEPGERGDLGAGVTGGDLETLLAIMGGPAAMASILGSLVMSDAAGLPLTTSLGLSDLVAMADGGAGTVGPSTAADLRSGGAGGLSFGGDPFGGGVPVGPSTAGDLRLGGGGGLSFGGPGPSFGGGDSTPGFSGGGGSLSKEKTTGRVAGPV